MTADCGGSGEEDVVVDTGKSEDRRNVSHAAAREVIVDPVTALVAASMRFGDRFAQHATHAATTPAVAGPAI